MLRCNLHFPLLEETDLSNHDLVVGTLIDQQENSRTDIRTSGHIGLIEDH
jgi:hypothetical protein